MRSTIVYAFVAAIAAAAAPAAQGAPEARAPLDIRKDPSLAPSGVYILDANHQSVIARVPHLTGMSLSTFRFDAAAGSLTWDPANLEASRLDVTVQTGSVRNPVPGFAEQIAGADYLNAGEFPQARFVSRRIERTSPTSGRIHGDLTLMGKTAPMTIEAELVGAGRSLRGFPTVGFTGRARLKRSDYGFTSFPTSFGDEIELILDVEFNLRPST